MFADGTLQHYGSLFFSYLWLSWTFSLNMYKLGCILILKLKHLALVWLGGIYSPCSMMADTEEKGAPCTMQIVVNKRNINQEAQGEKQWKIDVIKWNMNELYRSTLKRRQRKVVRLQTERERSPPCKKWLSGISKWYRKDKLQHGNEFIVFWRGFVVLGFFFDIDYAWF